MTEVVGAVESHTAGQPGEPPQVRRGRARSVWGKVASGPGPLLLGTAGLWIVFQFVTGSSFISARNLSNLSVQLMVILVLSLGAFVVILTGQIDLSMGSTLGACAALLAVLLQAHWNAWAAILATLALGVVIGTVQGVISAFLGVPPFVVTLGGFLAVMGLQYLLIGGKGEIAVFDPLIVAIANDYLPKWSAWLLLVAITVTSFALQVLQQRRWARSGIADKPSWRTIIVRTLTLFVVAGGIVALLNSYMGVAYVVVLAGIFACAIGWVIYRTPFGRYLYAVGGNEAAAERAGIAVERVKVVALALSGLFAAIAGILSASLVYSVSNTTGGGVLLLEAIAAVVVGGTSLLGGAGRIYQPVLGALVIVSIANGLGLLGVSIATTYMVTGSILVVAVSVDAISKRRR